jgi:hypothetical protein
MQEEVSLLGRDIQDQSPKKHTPVTKDSINNSQPSNLYKWLTGTFTCIKCGKEYQTMSFGYGEAICPDCYNGEPSFVFYDKSYWLNRIIAKIPNQGTLIKEHFP